MNPADDSVTFKAFDQTWTITGDHKVKIFGRRSGNAFRMKTTLQSMIDRAAGHHVPTVMVLASAFNGSVKYEIVKTKKSDQDSEDIKS